MNLINKIFNKKNKQNLRSSICQAPLKSLRFEPLGVMRTCCYNIQVVAGVYPKSTILDAWNSSEMNLLREKINKQDLSYGCRLCAEQINNGEINTVKYLQFENLPESEHNFPVMLDFSLHNTCNLECIMCHGEFSSSIRKNREHLSPMNMVYDEEFVNQLRNSIYSKYGLFLYHQKEKRNNNNSIQKHSDMNLNKILLPLKGTTNKLVQLKDIRPYTSHYIIK